MIHYISANIVFPVTSAPIRNGVIGVDEDGQIIAILKPEEAQNIQNIKYYEGVIVPGFINTHCHLELSHLLSKVEEKTGLPEFIKQILALRVQNEEEILAAIENADQYMFENGIVAVGDISNLPITKKTKLKSKIYYHTFVEVFGFNRPSAPIIAEGIKIKEAFEPLKASIVPHAPYSVSQTLFKAIANVTSSSDVLSIHNQETQGENDLFEHGDGSFADFFADLGIAMREVHGLGENSLSYHLPQLPNQVNTLLVHNTCSMVKDIEFAKKVHQKLFWCLCPNANLYIENKLPDVQLFIAEDLTITLGTDSLASNHQLSILAEMKTLQDHKSISFSQSLPWATINGAKFLNIDVNYGSIEVGKKPGLLYINLNENQLITSSTKIHRLF